MTGEAYLCNWDLPLDASWPILPVDRTREVVDMRRPIAGGILVDVVKGQTTQMLTERVNSLWERFGLEALKTALLTLCLVNWSTCQARQVSHRSVVTANSCWHLPLIGTSTLIVSLKPSKLLELPRHSHS
jgi:hypothetical protein